MGFAAGLAMLRGEGFTTLCVQACLGFEAVCVKQGSLCKILIFLERGVSLKL